MNEELARKKENDLIKKLRDMGSLLVAFSGGVDSTYLVHVSKEAVGAGNMLAVTATSSTYPMSELEEAKALALGAGVRHRVITSEELDIKGFKDNPPDRCYYCKGELFSKLWEAAEAESLACVVDGSNSDDAGDYRPGMRAAREKKVASPLKECGLTKNEIRFLSRERGIPTWDKPAYACLASRFPYGDRIDADKLKMVERSEDFLKKLGFRQVRVRHHGQIARVELPKEELERALACGPRESIVGELKNIGFSYVALDLEGYRTGSMNEILGLVSIKK
ncbi:MAG: ATP-dependent sacrificial sulfur transferase LarE [Nitrospinae bacterium]|nr:ATP-dependent sacrificial sulfur transferase LarE [Nitrospinota bacterium]